MAFPMPLSMRLTLSACLAALLLAVVSPKSLAQMPNYSQTYQKNLSLHPGMSQGTNRYLYDRYYRNNIAVSPYISGALLGGGNSGTAYTNVIRPDMQRRNAAYTQQMQNVQKRKMQGNVGYTAHPGTGYLGAMPGSGLSPGLSKPTAAKGGNLGAYQNHWYGAWQR